MLNNKLLAKKLVYTIANWDKIKERRQKRKREKKEHKDFLESTFGKTRYYLSVWFGQWILFICNRKFYETHEAPAEYQKYYNDEAVANRYAKRLREKYETVNITEVYDKKKRCIGYLLSGKGKKAAEPVQQPSNVIPFRKATQH